MSADPRQCGSCNTPLDCDQRYCLSCGERTGAASPLLEDLQRRLTAGRPRASRDAATHMSPELPGGSSAAPLTTGGVGAGLRLPRPRVSLVLILVFLGFGTLLGSAAGSGGVQSAASPRRHLKLVLPATSASAKTSSAPSEAEAEAESEPPPAEEAATPEPAQETPTKTTAATEPSGGSEEGGKSGGASESAPTTLPAIKHVFEIVLSDEPYAAAFGPESKAHYLAHTLERKGELLVRYDAVAHEELANGIALLSGQGPTAQTAANCPTYSDLASSGVGTDEQVLGEGCVYPSATKTLPGQLTGKHLKWRAYLQDSEEADASASTCTHPALGAADPSADQAASTGAYATFRNPLVYFHSIVDSPSCDVDEVGLGRLKSDLASASGAPSFAYIVPGRCHDGNPTPCAAGAPAGPATADGTLEQIVPEIMASQAYKQGGLIAITIDEAPSGGEYGDSSSCCGQSSFPNLAGLAGPGAVVRGGGAVGALLISPFIKPASTSQEPYNHFSLLRTVEDIFKLPHLGYAALPGVKPLAPSLFAIKPKG